MSVRLPWSALFTVAVAVACASPTPEKVASSPDDVRDSGQEEPSGPVDTGEPAEPVVSQVLLPPCSLRLGPDQPEMRVPAVAATADNTPVAADIRWSSSDPAIVEVDEEGRLTAVASVGTAEIIASADGIDSLPLFVTVAPLVEGAVVIADDTVTAIRYELATPDGEAALATDLRTIVELTGETALTPGTPVKARGCLPIEGVVVDSGTTDAGSWMSVRPAGPTEIYAALDLTTAVYATLDDYELNDGLEDVFVLERTEEEVVITVRDPDAVWTLEPPSGEGAAAAFADDDDEACEFEDGSVTCAAEIVLNAEAETKFECEVSAETSITNRRELLSRARVVAGTFRAVIKPEFNRIDSRILVEGEGEDSVTRVLNGLQMAGVIEASASVEVELDVPSARINVECKGILLKQRLPTPYVMVRVEVQDGIWFEAGAETEETTLTVQAKGAGRYQINHNLYCPGDCTAADLVDAQQVDSDLEGSVDTNLDELADNPDLPRLNLNAGAGPYLAFGVAPTNVRDVGRLLGAALEVIDFYDDLLEDATVQELLDFEAFQAVAHGRDVSFAPAVSSLEGTLDGAEDFIDGILGGAAYTLVKLEYHLTVTGEHASLRDQLEDPTFRRNRRHDMTARMQFGMALTDTDSLDGLLTVMDERGAPNWFLVVVRNILNPLQDVAVDIESTGTVFDYTQGVLEARASGGIAPGEQVVFTVTLDEDATEWFGGPELAMVEIVVFDGVDDSETIEVLEAVSQAPRDPADRVFELTWEVPSDFDMAMPIAAAFVRPTPDGLRYEIADDSRVLLSGWTQVECGYTHCCGIVDSGSVACWGADGEGRATAPVIEEPVAVSTGEDHSCALDADGQVTCWGAASVVAGTPAGTFTSLSSGYAHACAIDEDGVRQCWGEGFDDTEGDDVLSGLGGVMMAGDHHTCAVEASGEVTCAGDSNYDVYDQSTPPELVFNPAGPEYASANQYSSCAVLDNGFYQCWGCAIKDHGNCREQARYVLAGCEDSSGPCAEAASSLDVVQVESGKHHTCVRTEDGRVTCHGCEEAVLPSSGVRVRGDYGQCDVPESVQGRVVDVAAGGFSTCLLYEEDTGRVNIECFGCDGLLGDISVDFGQCVSF